MRAALAWYLVVQILGVAAFRLTSGCFRALPDRGYGVSKTLGVLTCGLLLWFGTALGLLRNEVGGALLVAGGLLAAAAGAGPPRRPARQVVIAVEAVFLIAFSGWCVVRAFTPDVVHTEQPMDLMMLTAMSVSPAFPPADPWLAGYPIGYYYFGYWLMNTIALLAGTPPETTYNVAQACWLALLATGCFGLGLNLVGISGQAAGRRWLPIGAGVLAALTVAGTANLHALVEQVRTLANGTSPALALGSYWPGSRAVSDTSPGGQPIELITEFPFFSYLIGDNHPHLLTMPFLVVVLVCGLSLLREGRPHRLQLLLAFASAGALVGLNTWDAPAALLLLAIAVWGPCLARHRWADARRRAALVTPLLLLVVVVLVPYLVTAQSQVRGVLPNLFNPTHAGAFLTMFGSLVPGVVLLLAVAWREDRLRPMQLLRWVAGVLLTCALCLALSAAWAIGTVNGRRWLDATAGDLERPLAIAAARWATGWPVVTLVVIGVVVAASLVAARVRSAEERPAGLTFALVLAAIGLALTAVPELLYVHDAFGSRMNTVFKSYYQAWLYLGAAGSVGVVLAWRHGGGLRVGAVLATALLSTEPDVPGCGHAAGSGGRQRSPADARQSRLPRPRSARRAIGRRLGTRPRACHRARRTSARRELSSERGLDQHGHRPSRPSRVDWPRAAVARCVVCVDGRRTARSPGAHLPPGLCRRAPRHAGTLGCDAGLRGTGRTGPLRHHSRTRSPSRRRPVAGVRPGPRATLPSPWLTTRPATTCS